MRRAVEIEANGYDKHLPHAVDEDPGLRVQGVRL
jgi:hypothetical protein